jgi:spermidine synthase
LSLVHPIAGKPWPGRYGPLHMAYESGHLVVNSPHANQSWGSLHEVWQQCFAQERTTEAMPRSVLILGFGAGSIAHILRNELRLQAPIIGVDGDPVMLRLARENFGMDRLPALELVACDALEYLATTEGHHDLVLVDLFHDLDLAPGVEEEDFIRLLAKHLAPGGMACINTVDHSPVIRERIQRLERNLGACFNQLHSKRYNGSNLLFVATMDATGNSP